MSTSRHACARTLGLGSSKLRPHVAFMAFAGANRKRLHRRRMRIIAVAVAFAACASGAAGPGYAQAKDVGKATSLELSADVRVRMLAQQPAQRAADALQAAMNAGDARGSAVNAGDARGFAGMAIRGTGLVVYWKGDPPSSARNAIGRAQRYATVAIERAPHSLAELRQAEDAITRYLQANPSSGIHTVEIAVDGSGLVLATDRAVARGEIPSTTVPVKVIRRDRPALLSRLADSPPFWGGAQVVNSEMNAACSSGFAVTDGARQYLLTAGHCGRPGAWFSNGNNTRWIGAASRENVEHDLLLVPTSAGGRIYDGGVGVGEFSKGVAGYDWTHPGEYVCQSGATSGAVCNLQNTNMWWVVVCDYDPYQNYECYRNLTEADQVDGLTAARHGDSGGPVFSLSGSDHVIAKGTVTAGDGGRRLYYADFSSAVNDFGVAPILG